MPAFLRSGLVLVVAITVAVGITTLPIRAADDSKSLASRIKKLERGLETTQADLATAKSDVQALQAKLQYVSVEMDPINGLAGPHVIFEGCNVHVRSGSGDSTDGTVDLAGQAIIPDTAPLGLGNLIVGYNEQPLSGDPTRGGSHNLIVGPGHNYPSAAGVVFGQNNSSIGPLCIVSGGYNNRASGYTSSVSGGGSNTASGNDSSVSGGNSNVASGDSSSVSGGSFNTASNTLSSVSGGVINEAGGTFSSVSGGYFGTAPNAYDWRAGELFQED
jgi:hypothetical protein